MGFIKKLFPKKNYLKAAIAPGILNLGSEWITFTKSLASNPALQSFNDKYASDILCGILWYPSFRGLGFSKNSSLINSILGGGMFELAQYYNIYSGTADWNDILAYTIGGLAAYGIDKSIGKKANKKNLETEIIN